MFRRVLGPALIASAIIVSACSTGGGGAAPASGDAQPSAAGGSSDETVGVAVFRFANEYLSLIRDAIQAAGRSQGRTPRHRRRPERPAHPERADRPVHLQGSPGDRHQPGRPRARPTSPSTRPRPRTSRSSSSTRSPARGPVEPGTRPTTSAPRPRSPACMQGQLVIDYWKAHPGGRQERRRHHPVRDALRARRPPGRPAPHESTRSRPSTTPASRPRSSQREIGDWNRPLAIEQMGAIYAAAWRRHRVRARQQRQHGLGAIEALKANGYFGDAGKFMPVVGVDATEPALESHASG